jgi:hypothetical protein
VECPTHTVHRLWYWQWYQPFFPHEAAECPSAGNLYVGNASSVKILFANNQIACTGTSPVDTASIKIIDGGDISITDNMFSGFEEVLDITGTESLIVGGNVSYDTDGTTACSFGAWVTDAHDLGNVWDKPCVFP